MNRESTSSPNTHTEEIGVLRSPGLAETLPPSGMANLSAVLTATKPRTEPPASAAEQTKPAAVNTALEQLERLSALVELEVRKSGPQRSATPAPVAPTPVAPAPAAAPEAPAHHAAASEEPLEAYLDRFMERLVGKKNGAAESLAQTVPGAPVFAYNASTAEPSVVTSSPATVAEAPPPREPAKAPECRETMTAMRELANENARSAVAHYATANLSGRARLALIAAAGMSLISSSLAAGAMALTSATCLWGAIAAAVISAVPACRFFLLCRQFRATAGAVGEV